MKKCSYEHNNTDIGFITLAAATANVVRYLQLAEQKKEDRHRDAEPDRDDEQKAEKYRHAVDQRLSDLAAFERRANSNK